VARALARDPESRFASATEMLEEWWRVAAALDRAAPAPEVEVVFDEDEWVSTIAESLARTSSHTRSGTPISTPSIPSNPVVRTMDDPEVATDPELQRPTDGEHDPGGARGRSPCRGLARASDT
jgi:hypothetical protein